MREEKVAVFDFEPRKQAACGRKDKLSKEVKATYREIIERYFYSFRFLSEEKLKQGGVGIFINSAPSFGEASSIIYIHTLSRILQTNIR